MVFPGRRVPWSIGTMIRMRKSEDRGKANHGWLDTRFTFSFADYQDPQHMGFRSLRVINDDRIAPAGGFDTHPHRDMEIITYVLEGALEHKDSMGNGRVIRPGEFQYMGAGTGVFHSEFNPSSSEPVHLLQVWVLPDRRGYEPRYAEKKMSDVPSGGLHLITSRLGRDNSLSINQDAELWLGKLRRGDEVTHRLQPGRHAWVHVAEGDLDLNGQPFHAGDGAAISEEPELHFVACENTQVLIFDMN